MSEYYSPDNLATVILHVPKGLTPKWLLLGGPADGCEAQKARIQWPSIRIIGIEPNPEAYEWQLKNGWPSDCPLLLYALADSCGQDIELVYEPGKLRNASCDPDSLKGNRGNPSAVYRKAETISLDYLDWRYGPFEDAILWLDIEGSEYKALQGAKYLIERRAFVVMNLEMQNRVPGLMEGIPALLSPYGYHAVQEWNASESCRDRIYVRS